MKNKKQGILFDLDGTLWDSAQGVVDSWNVVLERFPDVDKVMTVEDIHGCMGLPMDEIGRKRFGGMGLSEERITEIMIACEEYENEYLTEHGGVLYPHLEDVLQILSKDYFLAIVSNCQVGYIEAFLTYHKLGRYFDDTENFGNTGLQKWDNMRLVCERNQLTSALYVGDIQRDYEAACKAELPFIHAAYGFGMIRDRVPEIRSLIELPNVVRDVFDSMETKQQ